MGLSEFKAWFEGFSEGVGDAPSPEQWAKIKAKVATISAPGLTYRDAMDAGKRPRGWHSDDLVPLTARYTEPMGHATCEADVSAKLYAEGRYEAAHDADPLSR